MSVSCFFCRNLISDYMEETLPALKTQEVISHIENCTACQRVLNQVKTTTQLLKNLPLQHIPSELFIRVTEALESKHRMIRSPKHLSRLVLAISLPLLLLVGVVLSFPTLFPWITYVNQSEDQVQYVRYFPLLQGASSVLDEQGTLLRSTEGLSGSLWEEGGMSAEDFERTFPGKGSPNP